MLESDPELADAMWLFRHPEKGGKKLTFSAILVWLKNEWGVSVSLSTLHSSYRWLALKRRWDAAEAMAQQARRELAKDPEISDADLDTFSERVLKAEVATGGDVKGYVALARLGLQRKALGHDERRLAILEAKAAQADAAAGVVGDGKLSEEEKAAKLKQIFRMG
jgi:hypothetical protein